MIEAWCERAAREVDRRSFRPLLLDASDEGDRRRLTEIIERASPSCHMELRGQLECLVKARNPTRKLKGEALADAVAQHLGGRTLERYGFWAYYPWSQRLVQVLGRPEFQELRCDRNHHKITRDEQARLRDRRVGVVGLSVGQASAVTLALEGVAGTLRLADFDELELSNMNRLRCGVHELGLNKAVLAARQIAEIDPYIDVQVQPEGVRPETLDEFLLGNGKIDLLVEECDDLELKVLVRERARALGIPVLMETSDRGLLDVERFDLEPERPLFHGLVGDVRGSDLRGLTTKEKVPFALAILDHEQLSMRLAASFAEIDHSISSWPQLASAVALGGAVVADATRRVLLGRPLASGRYYLDMEERTAASAGSHHEPRACALPEDPGPLRAPQAPPQAPRTPGAELGVEHLRELAGYAVLAPSGHNMQAWRFVGHGRGLRCEVDRERVMTELEFGRIGSDIGLGAAVENVVLAAGAAGWVAEPQGFEPHTGVCDVHVHVGRHRVAAPDPLFEQLLERCTNRQLGQGERLGPEDRAVLAGEAEASGARLEFVDARDGLGELAELVGTADVVALQMQGVHADLMHGMRWSSEQAARARDGLDVHALELSATDRAAMRIMTRWPVLEFLREHGFGDALKEGSQRSVCSAGAMAVLSVPHAGADAYFRGGRAVQRVWLRATERRLAVQPMMTLPAFLARLGTSGEQAFTAAQRSQMRSVAERFFALFPARSGNTQVMLLRLAYAPPPTARSIRRALSEVFSLEARG